MTHTTSGPPVGESAYTCVLGVTINVRASDAVGSNWEADYSLNSVNRPFPAFVICLCTKMSLLSLEFLFYLDSTFDGYVLMRLHLL